VNGYLPVIAKAPVESSRAAGTTIVIDRIPRVAASASRSATSIFITPGPASSTTWNFFSSASMEARLEEVREHLLGRGRHFCRVAPEEADHHDHHLGVLGELGLGIDEAQAWLPLLARLLVLGVAAVILVLAGCSTTQQQAVQETPAICGSSRTLCDQ